MGLREKLERLGQFVLDLVFPVSCLSCGKDGAYLCTECKVNLPKLEQQQCLACQKPSPFGKTHPECVSRNTVDGIISALPYPDKKIKKIIETLKYNFVSHLAAPLAELVSLEIDNQNLNGYFAEFVLVPVPLHPRRHNWRGFNQAELLAERLRERLNCKMDNSLARVRYTKPQTTLSQNERKTNVAEAFGFTNPIQGQKFLIVDDVVTTGSTINEIAKLLKKLGATEVWGLTAARG